MGLAILVGAIVDGALLISAVRRLTRVAEVDECDARSSDVQLLAGRGVVCIRRAVELAALLLGSGTGSSPAWPVVAAVDSRPSASPATTTKASAPASATSPGTTTTAIRAPSPGSTRAYGRSARRTQIAALECAAASLPSTTMSSVSIVTPPKTAARATPTARTTAVIRTLADRHRHQPEARCPRRPAHRSRWRPTTAHPPGCDDATVGSTLRRPTPLASAVRGATRSRRGLARCWPPCTDGRARPAPWSSGRGPRS